MRLDLRHWKEALSLAQKLDPSKVAIISKEQASALEFVGEYEAAREHYQQVLDSLLENSYELVFEYLYSARHLT